MLTSLAWLYRPQWSSVVFALRLVTAVSTALYISMWLELGRPFWSGLEVALMIQLLPGNTVARAAARVGGTLVAGVAGLVILGVFRQTPELMIAALAVWVSACAFALQFFRDNLSHGFGVIGFITGVIVMFTVSSASAGSPFDVAQSRVAECCVAAVTVAVVNVLFSTGSTARRYYLQRLQVLQAVAGEIQHVIDLARAHPIRDNDTDDTEDPHPRLVALAHSVRALEQLRPYVHLEHPGFSAFDALAQRMDRDLLSLTSALSALHIYLARHRDAVDTGPLETLAEPARRLADDTRADSDIKAAFDTAHEKLMAQRQAMSTHETPRPLADRIVLSRTLDIAERMRGILARHRMLVSEDRRRPSQARPPSSGFSWPVNWPRVVRNSLASLTAITIAGSIWLHFHNQVATIIIVALGGAIATLFSATPSPLASAANFAKGAVFATIASFVINFFWVPMANGYGSYVVLTAPVLFVAGLAMTQPSMALPARISVVIFELTLHTQNDVRIDLPTFAQFALGIYGAVGVAMLAFMLVVERNPLRQLHYQLRDIFKELASGLHGQRARFETRIYDRLDQLALLDAGGRHPYGLNQAVLAAINFVLETRRLTIYVQRAKLPETLAWRAEDLMGQIEADLSRGLISHDLDTLDTRLRALASDIATLFSQTPNGSRRRLIGQADMAAQLMACTLQDYRDAIEANDLSGLLRA